MSEVRDPPWFCPYCYEFCYESERELHIELHGPNPRLDGLQDRLAVLKAKRCLCCDDGYDDEACDCMDIQAEQREVEQEIASEGRSPSANIQPESSRNSARRPSGGR